MKDLSFAELRLANIRRDAQWDPHDLIDLEFRIKEFAGEVGEFFNVLKKLQREKLGLKGSRATLADLIREAADVQISWDLLCMELELDLAAATRLKFNETSEKHGFSVKLGD